MPITGYSNTISVTTAFDADALAYINALSADGYPLEAPEQTYINTLVTDFKSAGIWSKMKAIYPYCTSQRNLWSYTNDVTAGNWGRNNFSATANTTTDPDGTLTADTLIEDTSSGTHFIVNSNSAIALSNSNYTMSIYVKKIARDWFCLSLYDGTISRNAWFNINTGVLGTVVTGATASIQNAGNGWYRCSITMPMSASNVNYTAYYGANADNSIVYTGNGLASYYVWGAQLEIGSTATTYQPVATTASTIFASQFKYNLKDPRNLDAAFRQVFNGGWTYSKQGATPNGTNGYADSKFASNLLTNGSTHLSYYSRTNILSGNPIEIGTESPDFLLWYNAFSVTYGNFGSAMSYTPTLTNTAGFLLASRYTTTNGLIQYKSSQQLKTGLSGDSRSTKTIYLAALNTNAGSGNYFSTKQCAFASIGDGLTDSEASALYTSVQNFQNSMSRAV